MRTIEVSEVTKLVRQLCIDANYYLPADLRQAFVTARMRRNRRSARPSSVR